MIVYRLERKGGWGVFCDKNDKDKLGRITSYPEDSLYKYHGCTVGDGHYGSHRYACESLEALVEYFGSDFARLQNLGATVAVYKVRKNYVVMGEVELAYQYDKAEKVSI